MCDLFCKCPKCNGAFIPDFDLTIEAYEEFFRDGRVSLLVEEPPQFPSFFVLKCYKKGCLYSSKMSCEEILDIMSKNWAKIAWAETMSNMSKEYQFDKYFTRYLLDRGLNKFISEKDLQKNEVLRDYINYVERESSKKSND